jgi:hypothetical protein
MRAWSMPSDSASVVAIPGLKRFALAVARSNLTLGRALALRKPLNVAKSVPNTRS